MVRVDTDDDSEHTGITKVVVCLDPEPEPDDEEDDLEPLDLGDSTARTA